GSWTDAHSHPQDLCALRWSYAMLLLTAPCTQCNTLNQGLFRANRLMQCLGCGKWLRCFVCPSGHAIWVPILQTRLDSEFPCPECQALILVTPPNQQQRRQVRGQTFRSRVLRAIAGSTTLSLAVI